MENNNYENNFAPETEAQQPVQEQPVFQQPVAQPAENKVDFNAMADKVTDKAKDLLNECAPVVDKVKKLPKIVWIAAAAVVVLVIAAIIIISALGNTYKTPVQAAEKLLNMTSVEKILNNAPSVLNGFGESEAKKIIKIVKKSDMYKDAIEDAEDAYAEMVEGFKDEYGKNYKISLKIEEKEKLEKEDLKDFRDQLRNVADFGKQLDDMDSDDYEDMSDDTGISKADAKELVKVMQSFCKKCKSAEVKDGYELSLIVSITGSELDEPEEQEITVRVFKVDGRWVPDVFSLVGMMGGINIGSLIGGF